MLKTIFILWQALEWIGMPLKVQRFGSFHVPAGCTLKEMQAERFPGGSDLYVTSDDTDTSGIHHELGRRPV